MTVRGLFLFFTSTTLRRGNATCCLINFIREIRIDFCTTTGADSQATKTKAYWLVTGWLGGIT